MLTAPQTNLGLGRGWVGPEHGDSIWEGALLMAGVCTHRGVRVTMHWDIWRTAATKLLSRKTLPA